MMRAPRGLILAAALGTLLAWLGAPGPARAGTADVLRVEAVEEGRGVWRLSVTVRHPDQDPDHWADWWRVRTPEGAELGRRVLLHSHVHEQPFTRDERIRIPQGVPVVVVEAHDKLHGLGGAAVTVDLRRDAGPGYTVARRR
jgi:hypothetical protein